MGMQKHAKIDFGNSLGLYGDKLFPPAAAHVGKKEEA